MVFLAFLRDNARWLAGGFLLTLFSTVGQTTFISISSGNIRAEYGLSHGEFGTIYMVATLASALTLPRLGTVVDRYSVKQVTLFVVPMLALAAVMMAFSHHVAMLLVTIYLLRLFGQGMMVHNAYTAIARWFAAQRGRALSIIIIGHNAGDAGFPVAFVTLAAAIGWRNGWLVAAALLLFVALPASVALVSVNRTPRSTDPVPKIVDARDWTRAEVIRDPVFYMTLLGVAAPSFIVTTVFFHQVYLVELRGWSLGVFASTFVLMAAINTGFTLVSGHLIDRYSGVRLLPFVLLPLGLACFVLGGVEAQWSAFAFMALIGVSNGLSTTLFGAVWPEIYGLKHLGSIRSLIVSASVLASAAGPGLSGALIDAGVSYPLQIVAMGVYCLATSLVLWRASTIARGRAAS
jgi:sugar phosphate permease